MARRSLRWPSSVAIAVLQGIINYGIVLGYIRYKYMVVGRRIQELLNLERNPLAALRAIAF